MWRGTLKKKVAGGIICLTGLFLISSSVFAAEPHQNPETANPVLSGITLFRYYSDSLDSVLLKDPAEVEARLEKMPFANIHQSLEEATDSFAISSIGTAYLVVEIDEDLVKLRAPREQFRLDEVLEVADQTADRLSRANSELERIEQAVENAGTELGVFSSPEGSDLRQSYSEVLEKTDRIRGMLGLYNDLLANLLAETEKIEELLESPDITPEELLKATDITFEIQPVVAFVGDDIYFEGVLTSGKEPLAGREVDILINSSWYTTVRTDADGIYQGKLPVPYWYIPELDLQALYYPRDKDIGLYLASLSPVIKLEVLFYEAGLEVMVEDKAYPGLATTLRGRFDYGQFAPLSQRNIEIYFDDILVTGVVAQETFTQEIEIDPQAEVGEHSITVSAVASDRYSSVAVSVLLIVTKAAPILDLDIPTVAMIPGNVELGGKLYSEVGPLNGASLKIGLGKSQIELVSSEDGTFDSKIKVGMGLGVIGSQDLIIQALPQEPWHAPLATTKSVMMVNMVNCGGILAILIFLGIYLPSRLRKRLGAYPRSRTRPEVTISLPEPAPVYSESVMFPAQVAEHRQDSGEPRSRIFNWYRLVIRLIQGTTKTLLKPHQTPREFARANVSTLGPAAKYFIKLTEIVERLLYSQYRPTEKDAGESQQLSHTIEEELKREGI